MGEISIRELRDMLAQMEDVLARRGELLITRRGKPVARLLPVEEETSRISHADLRARMSCPSVSSADLLRKDRDFR